MFVTDVAPVDTSALVAFDFTQLVLDDFYKNSNATRNVSAVLANVSSPDANFVSKLIANGCRYVDFNFFEEDDNKSEVHLPALVYNLNGQDNVVDWTMYDLDDLYRVANVRLDLLTLRDGYTISFNYIPASIFTVRY